MPVEGRRMRCAHLIFLRSNSMPRFDCRCSFIILMLACPFFMDSHDSVLIWRHKSHDLEEVLHPRRQGTQGPLFT